MEVVDVVAMEGEFRNVLRIARKEEVFVRLPDGMIFAIAQVPDDDPRMDAVYEAIQRRPRMERFVEDA